MKIFKLRVNKSQAPEGDEIFFYAIYAGNDYYHLILDGGTWVVSKHQAIVIGEIELDDIVTRGPAVHYTTSRTETTTLPVVSLRDLLGQDIAEIRLK